MGEIAILFLQNNHYFFKENPEDIRKGKTCIFVNGPSEKTHIHRYTMNVRGRTPQKEACRLTLPAPEEEGHILIRSICIFSVHTLVV